MSIEAMKQAVEAFEHIKKYVTDDGAMPENWDAYHEKEYYALEALRQAIEQAERKPVKSYTGGVPQYATDAPKREWVGLSNDEVAIYSNQFNGIRLVREIEAVLKERNT
jgi:hypothetical protein